MKAGGGFSVGWKTFLSHPIRYGDKGTLSVAFRFGFGLLIFMQYLQLTKQSRESKLHADLCEKNIYFCW